MDEATRRQTLENELSRTEKYKPNSYTMEQVFDTTGVVDRVIFNNPELLSGEGVANRLIQLLLDVGTALNNGKVPEDKQFKYSSDNLKKILIDVAHELYELVNDDQVISMVDPELANRLHDFVMGNEIIDLADDRLKVYKRKEEIKGVGQGQRTETQVENSREIARTAYDKLGKLIQEGEIQKILTLAEKKNISPYELIIDNLAHTALDSLFDESGAPVTLELALQQSYYRFAAMVELVMNIYMADFKQPEDCAKFIEYAFKYIDETAETLIDTYYVGEQDVKLVHFPEDKSNHAQKYEKYTAKYYDTPSHNVMVWLDAVAWRHALKAKMLRDIEQRFRKR